MFDFKFEIDEDFKEAVLVSDSDLSFCQPILSMKYLNKECRFRVDVGELYIQLKTCVKNDCYLDLEYIDTLEFQDYLETGIKDGKVYVKGLNGFWEFDGIEILKMFFKELMQSIETMFLSLENGSVYLKYLQSIEIPNYARAFMSIDIFASDFYKQFDKISIKDRDVELNGRLKLGKNTVFYVDYISLYLDLIQIPEKIKNNTFTQYKYRKRNDSTDIFTITKIEDCKYELNSSGKKEILHSYERNKLEHIVTLYIQQFEDLCIQAGDKGKSLLAKIKQKG